VGWSTVPSVASTGLQAVLDDGAILGRLGQLVGGVELHRELDALYGRALGAGYILLGAARAAALGFRGTLLQRAAELIRVVTEPYWV
jgi:hypothetical protein